jgi:aerobic-type carbon monoxide dehydrogenase small subunit (CoxS/CutS family)
MATAVQFTVNSRPQRVETDPRRTLLEVLREDLGLTGTKYGCGEGQFRACTVLLDGKAVQSCQTAMDEVEGRKIETIEGLATGAKLHPVQQAFVAEGAMQCGYCVPGMIMATVGLLRRNPAPTKAEIISGLNGNLCRCCGYGNVVKAVERAAKGAKGAKEAK